MVNYLEGKMLKMRMKYHYDNIVSTTHTKFAYHRDEVWTNQLLFLTDYWVLKSEHY